MIAYFRFALIAILLAGIACVSAIVTMQFAVHGAIVTVPDLRGVSVQEAGSRAAALGLDVTVTQRFYSTVLPAGSVLLQSPAADSHVRRGWNLAVAESLGPQKVAVPDVLGKNEREAILLIRQKGLELGSIAYLPDALARTGTVLAQDPGPNARGAERPSVSLLLAAAAPVEGDAYVMPREVGRSYEDASAQLEKAGLRVQSTPILPAGAIVTLSSATAPGTVVWQQPPAGARVDTGSTIVLSVPGSAATASAVAATPTAKRP